MLTTYATASNPITNLILSSSKYFCLRVKISLLAFQIFKTGIFVTILSDFSNASFLSFIFIKTKLCFSMINRRIGITPRALYKNPLYFPRLIEDKHQQNMIWLLKSRSLVIRTCTVNYFTYRKTIILLTD